MKSYKSIDDYIATFSEEIQGRLNVIRKTIKENVPVEAEETISYQIPTFKLNGKFIIYFAGFKNHISIYPIPAGPVSFQKKIEPYIKGKGTIQFSNDKQLPIGLILEIIKYSVEANQSISKN